MKKRTLLLVRHGLTVMNQQELFQGLLDSDLSEEGVVESLTLGKYVKDNYCQPDLIYCSPYGRAKKTCELVLSSFETHPDVIYDQNLVELDFGIFEGKKYSLCKEYYPKTFEQLYEDPRNYVPLNGESLSNILGRVFIFYRDLMANKNWETALVVTHGVVVRCFLHHIFNRTIDDFWVDAPIDASTVTEVLLGEETSQHKLLKYSYKK